jgi:hypothetical protein
MREGFMSRSGESHPFGKLTFDLPRTKVCEDAGEVVSKRAQSIGMSIAEYVRWVVTVHALGHEQAERLLRRRVAVVGRIGQEDKTEGAYGDRRQPS